MNLEDRRLVARFIVLISIVLLIADVAPSQKKMISAKAGAISFVEGDVYLDGKRIQPPKDNYIFMQNGQSLITRQGRVEIYINPEVYLRLSKNSCLRIEDNSLMDTQLVLDQGTAWISVNNTILHGNRIRVRILGTVIEVKNTGQYRIDADTRELRVFGFGAAAEVSFGDKKAKVKKGRMVRLDSNLKPAKFNSNNDDYKHEWTAGVIECILGEVFLDKRPVKVDKGIYNQTAAGQSLSTKSGYAELQLAPYAYLRLGIHGSLRVEKIQPKDIQLVLDQGAALIEAIQENHIRVRVSKGVIELKKAGLYRLNAKTREIQTYGGEAVVSAGNRKVKVKKGKMVCLDTGLAPVEFDTSVADSLHKWAARRSLDNFVDSADPMPLFRKLRNWKHNGKGWLSSSNYRMRFYSEEFYARWLGSGYMYRPSYPTVQDLEFLTQEDPPSGYPQTQPQQ